MFIKRRYGRFENTSGYIAEQETSELSPSKSIDSHEWKDWLDSETDLGYTSLKWECALRGNEK